MDALNFVFPNDLHVHWSMMIVLYPYLTGLVDGSFIVAALYYVFGVKSLKPISRFSLVFALAFLSCAMFPLLMHLGRPERNHNMMITPSPTSAMSGAGYIYTVAIILIALIVLLVYRPILVKRRRESKGIMKILYRVLTMDSTNLSPESLALDRKIIKFLVAVGIPVATILHGYVGFLFGGVKANPSWSTPLMPVIFLFSACVSGISALVLAYIVIKKIRRQSVDTACVRTCINILAGFFILAFSFEMLEVFSHSYLRTWYHHSVEGLLNGPLFYSFWVWQVGICSVLPVFLLGWLCLFPMKEGLFKFFAAAVSSILLLQVLLMRWNVVIGGQLMSKSTRGYTQFHPEWFDKEGILTVIVLVSLPFMVLFILSRIFPLWLDERKASA